MIRPGCGGETAVSRTHLTRYGGANVSRASLAAADLASQCSYAGPLLVRRLFALLARRASIQAGHRRLRFESLTSLVSGILQSEHVRITKPPKPVPSARLSPKVARGLMVRRKTAQRSRTHGPGALSPSSQANARSGATL